MISFQIFIYLHKVGRAGGGGEGGAGGEEEIFIGYCDSSSEFWLCN